MPEIPLPDGRSFIRRHADFPSRYVPARDIDVWCPPDYTANDTHYPVLYMHDGQNLFLPGYSYGGIPWDVHVAATRLIETGVIPGVIIVGVWNVGGNRWGEYLPQQPADTPAGRAIAAQFADRFSGAVCSDAYLKFLVEEVKPFIDATYRTQPDQAHTFVMGSSMGGLISLYAVCQYPRVFGGAGCVSTHWVAGENLMVDYFGAVLPNPIDHRLYFDYGTETADAAYEPFQVRMDDHLAARGYVREKNWITRKFDGAEHSERAWRERVHIPLEFLLKEAR
jgi:predicted alpha/beta superfamily hydrolase